MDRPKTWTIYAEERYHIHNSNGAYTMVLKFSDGYHLSLAARSRTYTPGSQYNALPRTSTPRNQCNANEMLLLRTNTPKESVKRGQTCCRPLSPHPPLPESVNTDEDLAAATLGLVGRVSLASRISLSPPSFIKVGPVASKCHSSIILYKSLATQFSSSLKQKARHSLQPTTCLLLYKVLSALLSRMLSK